MSDRPDYVIACSEIGTVMYPEDKAVGLQIIDPAGQKLFISLPGRLMGELGRQLKEFADQHPEVSDWQPVLYSQGASGPPA
ncbi:MAG: hypothetical protein ACE5LB_02780 [Acidiferrobacterales bacterium]